MVASLLTSVAFQRAVKYRFKLSSIITDKVIFRENIYNLQIFISFFSGFIKPIIFLAIGHTCYMFLLRDFGLIEENNRTPEEFLEIYRWNI